MNCINEEFEYSVQLDTAKPLHGRGTITNPLTSEELESFDSYRWDMGLKVPSNDVGTITGDWIESVYGEPPTTITLSQLGHLLLRRKQRWFPNSENSCDVGNGTVIGKHVEFGVSLSLTQSCNYVGDLNGDSSAISGEVTCYGGITNESTSQKFTLLRK
jgi:hypothetical protein